MYILVQIFRVVFKLNFCFIWLHFLLFFCLQQTLRIVLIMEKKSVSSSIFNAPFIKECSTKYICIMCHSVYLRIYLTTIFCPWFDDFVWYGLLLNFSSIKWFDLHAETKWINMRWSCVYSLLRIEERNSGMMTEVICMHFISIQNSKNMCRFVF